jgi:hypothetical protein
MPIKMLYLSSMSYRSVIFACKSGDPLLEVWKECCFFFKFFPDFIHTVFCNTIFIPAVIQGWAQPCWVVTPAPGLHGGGVVTGWESNPGLEINSHQVRIEPGTGHQQSSVLTTELRCTPNNKKTKSNEKISNRNKRVLGKNCWFLNEIASKKMLWKL